MADKSVLSNHRVLAKSNVEFVEMMLSKPHLVAEQQRRIRSGDIPAAYEELRQFVSPWPVIIGSKYKNEMAEVTGKLGTLLYKAMVLLAREFPALFKKQYDLPLEWFTEIDPDEVTGSGMIGRYDALVSRGALKLVEYNAGTNIGGWHLYRMSDIYRDIAAQIKGLNCTPILEEFLVFLEGMTRQRLGEVNRPLNLLFEFGSESEKNEFVSSLPFFEEAIEKRQLNLRLLFDIDFRQLEVDEHGAWLDGERIDALSVPVFNFDFNVEKIRKLTRLHWQKKVMFPDNPIYLTAGSKSNFANLHFLIQQNRLSKEEAVLVSKYIPWTHPMGDELNVLAGSQSSFYLKRLLREKDEYVLKRDGLLGGEHVYVGKFMKDAAWESVLSLARKSPGWIVQRYYSSDWFYAPTNDGGIVPHDYIFGFFDFGSRYGGAGVRLMQSQTGDGVINSAKGAHYTAVFEVRTNSFVI